MTRAFFGKRFAASIAAASMLMPLTFGLATAQAENPGAQVDRASIEQLIKIDKETVKLTVHKLKGEANNDGADGKKKNDGSKRDDVKGEPFEATFEIRRIGDLDPKKLGDWKTYSELNIDGYKKGDTKIGEHTLGEATTVKTEKGEKSVDLPMGFYIVNEIPQKGTSVVKPFAVALPMTNNTSNGWNYDVHVYPKNQVFNIQKDVSDRYAVPGSTIEYTLTGDTVAPKDKATTYSRYAMTDRQPEHIKVNREKGENGIRVSIGDTALEAGDYNVRAGKAADTDTVIELTESGLKKLFDARKADPSVKVIVKVKAVVGDVGKDATNGKPDRQVNRAYLFAESDSGNPDDPKEEEVPNDDAESQFGKVTLNKTDNEAKPLEGAEFQLYRCEQGKTGPEAKTIAGPITVNGKDTWTTGKDGKVSVTGLQLEDFYNGKQNADEFDYCFVEKQAPEGFELLPNPATFSVKSGSEAAELNVENIPDNGGNDLPFTGENGIMWILAAAGLLGVVGVAMFLSTGRREA